MSGAIKDVLGPDFIPGNVPQAKPSGVAGAVAGGLSAAIQEARIDQLSKQVDHLTKLVHILWKEAEKLQSLVKVTPDGLQIKTALSEFLVLKNGGIVIKGMRIGLISPTKTELML